MKTLPEGIRDAFRCFSRNNRWGTCGDCPCDYSGKVSYPEFCQNTDRYDHQMTLDELVRVYRSWAK